MQKHEACDNVDADNSLQPGTPTYAHDLLQLQMISENVGCLCAVLFWTPLSKLVSTQSCNAAMSEAVAVY